jgi:branched-chain amino acid transport system substrate-binding protein
MRRIGLRAFTSAIIAAGALVGVTSLSAPAPAGAATAAPIVLGDICSCTGPEASTISQTSPALQAWASYVNAHGGVQGHQVQVVVKDDAYNPGTSLAAAKDLVNSNHVVGIFDNSDEDSSWAAYIKQQNVPVFGGQEMVAGYTNSDFFPPGGTYEYGGDVGSLAAKKAGVKKEAELYCVEVAICAQSVATTKQALARLGGMKLVYDAGIGFAAPNYTAQCLAAKASGADAMSVADASAIVTKVAQDCAAQGYTPRELSGDGSVAIAWLDVPAMEGNIDFQTDVPWFVHNATTKPMYDALAKYAPGVTTGPNFGEVVLQDWAMGALLQEAAKYGHLTATPTAAQLKSGLYALPKGDTLGGLTPPLHFVKGQPADNPCFFVMGIHNKKFVTLEGGKPLCVAKRPPGVS